MKRFFLALLFIPYLTGCYVLLAGGAGAVGTYVWMQGNLERNYRQPLDTAMEGSLHALRNMRFKIVKNKQDSHYGLIAARRPSTNEELTVALERWTNVETKITVRAGSFGDRNISRHVHEEIEKALR